MELWLRVCGGGGAAGVGAGRVHGPAGWKEFVLVILFPRARMEDADEVGEAGI